MAKRAEVCFPGKNSTFVNLIKEQGFICKSFIINTLIAPLNTTSLIETGRGQSWGTRKTVSTKRPIRYATSWHPRHSLSGPSCHVIIRVGPRLGFRRSHSCRFPSSFPSQIPLETAWEVFHFTHQKVVFFWLLVCPHLPQNHFPSLREQFPRIEKRFSGTKERFYHFLVSSLSSESITVPSVSA